MKTLASLSGLGLLSLSLLVPACAADPDTSKDEPVESTTQDFSLRDTRIVGSLAYGDTSGVTPYTRFPRYRAYKFAGNAGDDVDVWVKSNNGDPVTWILDNDWKIIASNDDAPGTTNSHVKTKLPANPSATHYIVVRDYDLRPMTFKVELKGGPADLTAGCNVDADCVKVAAKCCDLGDYTAVKAGNEAAYRESLACPTPLYCPMMMARPDHSMAECNQGTHKCELVKPADIKCGGFVTPAMQHECPAGYSCTHAPGTLPDLPGKCVQHCGGIAGFTCHDPNEECVDDPSDDCDPKKGGADCGGICQPKASPPPPPPPSDCRSTGCGTGKWCSMCWGSYQCIPNGALC